MIEAVGHQYYDTYFRCCSDLLKPGGLMLLQAITIADQQYEAARDSVDFIKRHIFPGCCIPSIAAISASVARASELRIVGLEDIGPHYATTLAHWRANLLRNAPRCARWATMTPSCACGSSTSATAKAGSPRGRWGMRRSCSSSRRWVSPSGRQASPIRAPTRDLPDLV
jgi:hypothetical protein